MVNVQNDALARSDFFSPLSAPQVRNERVAETKRNLETDACSGDSQTSGDTRIVSGDLTFVGKIQSWQNPSVVSRFPEVEGFWQLRVRTPVVRASPGEFDHLPGCTRFLEFSPKKTASSEEGSSLAH